MTCLLLLLRLCLCITKMGCILPSCQNKSLKCPDPLLCAIWKAQAMVPVLRKLITQWRRAELSSKTAQQPQAPFLCLKGSVLDLRFALLHPLPSIAWTEWPGAEFPLAVISLKVNCLYIHVCFQNVRAHQRNGTVCSFLYWST